MTWRSLIVAIAASLALVGCAKAMAVASLNEQQGGIDSNQVNTERHEDENPERDSEMDLQNPLDDDALRSLLLDAYATHPRHPSLSVGDPWGETFDIRGVYFKNEGRIRREGVFEIVNGKICVAGPSINRRCRSVYSNGDGVYTFVDDLSGNRELLAVTRR